MAVGLPPSTETTASSLQSADTEDQGPSRKKATHRPSGDTFRCSIAPIGPQGVSRGCDTGMMTLAGPPERGNRAMDLAPDQGSIPRSLRLAASQRPSGDQAGECQPAAMGCYNSFFCIQHRGVRVRRPRPRAGWTQRDGYGPGSGAPDANDPHAPLTRKRDELSIGRECRSANLAETGELALLPFLPDPEVTTPHEGDLTRRTSAKRRRHTAIIRPRRVLIGLPPRPKCDTEPSSVLPPILGTRVGRTSDPNGLQMAYRWRAYDVHMACTCPSSGLLLMSGDGWRKGPEVQ